MLRCAQHDKKELAANSVSLPFMTPRGDECRKKIVKNL
jgi:hypothetical protein